MTNRARTIERELERATDLLTKTRITITPFIEQFSDIKVADAEIADIQRRIFKLINRLTR